MSSSRATGMVLFWTKAVRLAPHQDVPESNVISPGIVIYKKSFQGEVRHDPEQKLTSNPVMADIVECCADQSDIITAEERSV